MGGQVVGFMTYMITGMSTAVTVILGKFIGEKKRGEAGNAIGNAIIFFTAVTVTAVDIPVIIYVIKPTTWPPMETPETLAVDENCPTISRSTALYSVCKIRAASIGSINLISLLRIGPSVKSLFLSMR